ncbi:MAG: hypothetical protein KZQ96_23360 [Candidatus Thiodiazotropha sp. (ex Lucinoma borealis)]|nr:hypothetical protein [Candidatus Thiodiazotropha sp. (ex Lucinoma borealis)]
MYNRKPFTPNITVVDSLMGTGKSTWLIKYLNDEYADITTRSPGNPPKKFIVIVHSLDEVDRFTEACPTLGFKNPEPIYGRKLYGLQSLTDDGENIVTTHSLFKSMTPEVIESFHSYGYTLMIDEVLSSVEIFSNLSPKDREMLFTGGYVSADEDTGRLRWNNDDHGDYPLTGRFNDIRKLCEIGSVVLFRDTTLLWEFPSEFLQAFHDIYVFTYLFEGSPMAAYLKSQGFTYTAKSVNESMDGLIDICEVDESAVKARLRELITIYEGPMNEIGRKPRRGNEKPLSASWYKRAAKDGTDKLKQLKSSTENFFKKISATPASDNMWTVYKASAKTLKGARYARQWTPLNLKATNDLVDKKAAAYLCNLHLHTSIRNYFISRNISVSDDLFALSEMVQWIWRSQIRRGDPITLYVPSSRMRELLRNWLNSSNILELSQAA